MPRPRQIISLALLAVSLGLFALPGSPLGSVMPSARADGTFNVNWPGDAPDSDTSDGVCNDGNNRCTLRAAIQQANASGGGTINVAALGTITLTSALPDINANISIIGPGARLLTVSGADSFRVFNISNSAVNFSVSGMTITGGRAGFGAGLNNSGGLLTISNCVVTNNTATGFGGGINNNNGGKLSVVGTTIAYNSANSAGGLFNIGLATIADTTISYNTSATNGGGAENVGTMFVLLSDTIYGNSAQGAGGGIHNPGIGVLDFNNTVVAGNSAGSSGPDIDGANLVSHDYNLVENTSGADISGTRTHNITGTAPALGTLQYNGGATLTHAPLPGSVVIDQGNASIFSPLTLDQRGLTRPVDLPSVANAAGGDGADIGAFEIQSGEALTVNSLADTNDGQCDTQNCTLREAINAANASAGYNSINFSVTGTIDLTSALPDVATDMAVEGPGAKSLTVRRSTSSEYRIFSVASGVTARISGLTVANGNTTDAFGGGGILNQGTLVVSAVAAVGNFAIGGGAINNRAGATLYVVDSTFSGNSTQIGGGGGVFSSGHLNVLNSTFSGNNAGGGSGGGVLHSGASCLITNSTFSNNSGGGISNISSDSPVVLASSIVANSTSPGGVDLSGGLGTEFQSNGYNLIETPGSAGVVEVSNPGTNIYGQDPKLGPLADNGGQTQTHALASDSPAIDKGRDFAKGFFFDPAPADQRGAARPYDFSAIANASGGDNSDIGAFELRPVAETPTSKAVNEDSTLTFNFFAGDQTITSISATSSDQTLVSDSDISFFGSGSERTIQIKPAANAYGSVTITVHLVGSSEGATTRSFRLNVNPVNDAPSFVKGADQTVLEDAGPQAVSNWATSISAGPNESSQTVSFNVTGNTNPSLFSAAPSVSANGTLTFTPAPDANGSATITIVLRDDGGTLNGGQDTSVAQTFVINVTAVNDAPTANNQTVATDEDTPKAITLTGSDVDGDALTFQVVNGPSHGTLTGTGASRTYTPAGDFNGDDIFTFKAVDPSNAESAPANVIINIAAVNDAPVNTVPGAQLTARDTQLVFSASNSNAVSVSDVDAGTNALRVTLTATNGTLTLGGTSGLTFSAGDGANDATMTFTGTAANINAALAGLTFKPTTGFDGAASLQITTDDQGNTGSGGAKSDTDTIAITVARSTVEFAQSSYTVAETAGSLSVTVRRLGDTSQAASVDYATDDGTNNGPVVPCSSVTGLALDRCDFTKALGTLRFAAGETEKTFVILVSDDSYTEGTETAHVTLTNAGGVATLGTRASATFEITDDSPESATNPIDDSAKFVRQHYHDFLNREPDASGLAFWVNEIEKCGQDAQCREVRRINVSAAFFQSIEFQETGYLVERIYKTAYGDTTSPNVPGTVPVIRFNEFLVDTQEIGRGIVVGVGDWQNQLEANKNAYALAFVQRARFIGAFPSNMSAGMFVDKLAENAGLTLTQSERDQLVAVLGSTPSDASKRAQVLRAVAENSRLRQAELNRAFVLMQYYGYMRRNPDDLQDTDFRGWKFWLDKLNQFNGNFVQAEMVKAFISSDEYRHRFGQ